MSQRNLPRTILPIELADRGSVLQGELALSSLSRLKDMLMDAAGTVKVELRFGKNAEKQRFLTGSLLGRVKLTCQRCLQPVELNIELPVKLGIVLSDVAAEHLPKEYEPLIVTTEPMALVDIIEEELLLGLPLVAKHPEGECPAGFPKQKTH